MKGVLIKFSNDKDLFTAYESWLELVCIWEERSSLEYSVGLEFCKEGGGLIKVVCKQKL